MSEGQYLPLQQTATRLGVPVAWLKSEADAGHIPCIRAGRRLLFKLALVSEALDRRAEESLAAQQPEVARA